MLSCEICKIFYRTPPVASSEHYVLNYDYSENVTDSLIPVGSYNIIQARRNEKNSAGGLRIMKKNCISNRLKRLKELNICSR